MTIDTRDQPQPFCSSAYKKMNFNDLLAKAGIDSSTVLVFRHRPFEPKLRRVLPWLAGQKPDLFNAYQRSQGPKAEKAMTKAEYVAAFVGDDAGRTIFVGLYKRGDWRSLTREELFAIPENQELTQYGMGDYGGEWDSSLWFDLKPKDFYQEWSGRLIVDWPGGKLSWWRWAEKNTFSIIAIAEESLFDPPMPDWREISLGFAELQALPNNWRNALAQWRGVYFIFDIGDQKGYVGSAYGKDNILGRWMTYAATRHGGNVELRGRAAENFQFTILERVSPDMEAEDVVRLESLWKDRLHTREYGLNKN